MKTQLLIVVALSLIFVTSAQDCGLVAAAVDCVGPVVELVIMQGKLIIIIIIYI